MTPHKVYIWHIIVLYHLLFPWFSAFWMPLFFVLFCFILFCFVLVSYKLCYRLEVASFDFISINKHFTLKKYFSWESRESVPICWFISQLPEMDRTGTGKTPEYFQSFDISSSLLLTSAFLCNIGSISLPWVGGFYSLA